MNSPQKDLFTQTIHSFVLRQGRLTDSQKKALRLANKYLLTVGNITATQQTELRLVDSVRLNNSDLSNAMRTFFPIENEHVSLNLEIGFGDGSNLIQNAIRHPKQFHLGIEVHLPGIARAIDQCHKQDIQNVKLIRLDVKQLFNYQTPLAIFQQIEILFPDPWHKKKHHKRRLINHPFLEQLSNWLVNDGRLTIYTDSEDYAENISAALQQCRLLHQCRSCQSNQDNTNIASKYHRRAIKLNHNIFSFHFFRQLNSN